MTGIVRAPDFDQPGLAWFNVDKPLTLAGLRGKLVILDFWTFCCINCMHILPTLRRVEEAFPEEVAVIGIHSPKFTAERAAANVAAAIARYGIVHPVVHDPEFRLWREYAVRAWPTLIFVSPDGRVIGQHSGEPDPERLLEAVGRTLAQWRAEGALRPGALALAPPPLPPAGAPHRRLSFPGKIKRMPGAAKRWGLADAGHHQIVLFDDAGGEIARYGAGAPGFVDGTAEAARFNGPQGLIADEQAIYVADTGNHALRRIDRADGRITTLAGSGRRGMALGESTAARETALASPWDLEYANGLLYFANAGTHQLGVLDLAGGTVARLAGSGAEAIIDGGPAEAALAQPSGLALTPDRTRLYFVDSETSALRAVRLDGAGRVETLIGSGLFDFGHANGALAEARLQHPLGVAWWDGRIAVADSYNAALRAVDPVAGTVSDLDDGFLCSDALCLPLAEPAGIIADGPHRLLVADTNNHRVVEYDTAARRSRNWAG